MNYNMYTNRLSDNIDPNYIYPQPYIDPLMYMNPYFMNNQNNNPQYATYLNQYADNPQFNPYDNVNNNTNMDANNNGMNSNLSNMNNETSNIPMIPIMPPNMMYPNAVYPGMFPPNMMYPGFIPANMIYPNMMYPDMFFQNGMFPNPISNIPTVNMEEFDEEEM